MKSKLKIGVIGAGNIAMSSHFPAYSRMDNVEIVAVCDIDEEALKEACEKFSIKKSYTDYKEMIEKEQPDAIDICTPNYLHSIIAYYALEKGINVFCEKPDAINEKEAEKMKKAAEKSGKTLMVMRNNRFRLSSQFLKKYIEDGKMGEIYASRCSWVRRRGIPGRGGWFTNKELSGGGPVIDLGVHMMDLAIWLMGNPTPVSVSSCTYRKFADAEDVISESDTRKRSKDGVFDVEDLAMGFIRFDNGACMQIEFSWASNVEKEGNVLELRGTKAGARFAGRETPQLKIFTEENNTLVDVVPAIDDSKGTQMHEANLRHFADVVLNGAKPIFEPWQGVDMIKILTAIYKSAEEGKEIIL